MNRILYLLVLGIARAGSARGRDFGGMKKALGDAGDYDNSNETCDEDQECGEHVFPFLFGVFPSDIITIS